MLDTQLGYLYLVSGADLLEVVRFMVELKFEQITVEDDFVKCVARGSQSGGFIFRSLQSVATLAAHRDVLQRQVFLPYHVS